MTGSRPVRLSLRAHALCILIPYLLLCEQGRAAPVAVDDTFTTPEDTALTVEGSIVLSAAFDSGAPLLASPWSYLNNLSNAAGTPYPVDGAGKTWKDPLFNTATSTVLPWLQSPMPMTAGGITFFSNNPTLPNFEVLDGGLTINTYLFRTTWTLTAAQAAIQQWTAHYLFDDGAIVYVNGSEAFRVNMPAGTVTPATVTPSGGNESTYTDQTVNLAGKLLPGANTVAIELHETGSFADAGIDFSLTAQDAMSFTYTGDALGTSAGGFNSGVLDAAGGYQNSSGLRVTVGGRTPSTATALPLSGAWVRQVSLPAGGSYLISFRYRGTVTPNYDANEFIEGVFRVNGTRFGGVAASGTVPGSGVCLYRFVGNGNGTSGGESVDTGWQTFSRTLNLSAGTHTLNFGLYNNTSSGASSTPETSDVYFDDIVLTLLGSENVSGVLINDTGAATRTAVKDSDPAHGTLTLNSNGSFTYTPVTNYAGPDSFTYHAVDDTGSSGTATVTLTVTPRPDPPVVQDDAYTTPEDTVLTVNAASGVLANDSDVDGDTLTAALRDAPVHGAVVLNSNGSFTYTPSVNYSGTDSFTYRVSDGTNTSDDHTVSLTVTPVNDVPVVVGDAYFTLFNTPLSVALTTNAGQNPTTQILVPAGSTVPPGHPTEIDLPLWKYLDDGSNQNTAWRNAGFNDTAWSVGRAELGYGDAGEGRPERTVVGYGPNAGAKYATTYFRTTFNVVGIAPLTGLGMRLMRDDAAAVYLNGTEIYRDSANLSSNAAYNTYATASISGTDEGLLMDLTSSLSTDALQSLVEGVNTLAVEVHQSAGDSTDLSMDLELSAQRLPYAGVLANDSDPENTTLSAQLLSGPSHGTLTLNPNGTFLYTPAQNYLGTDSFTYRATDGTLNSTGVTVNLSIVTNGNVPPTAGNDSFSASEDTVLTVPAPGVLTNDTDLENAALTAQKLTNPLHGALTVNADGSFTYSPALNYHGPDSFTYRARDEGGASSPAATVSITVNPVNDAPVAAADSYGANPGQQLTVGAAAGVLANDSDVESNPLTAVLVAVPAAGTLNLSSSGAFDYTPPPGYTGTQIFTYRASDGTATSAVTAVTIQINGAPVAGGDSYSTVEDTVLQVSAGNGVLTNDSDPENSPLTAQVVAFPLHGSLSLNPSGSFTYAPANDFEGSDSFTYRAGDGARLSSPAVVSLTVTAVNDAPVAANDSYRTAPSQTLTVDAAGGVLQNDRDAEGAALILSLVSNPLHGTLTLNADGSFAYTPVADFTGTDSFRYRLSDGTLTSADATVEITVAQTAEDIVINEIMFRYGGTWPEATAREFIELYNRGSRSIDLSGWRIDSGVSFTIPAGRVMPPGSYLVIAANVAAFQTVYPGVANVIGGWTGTLSNSGETIALVDAAGAALDEVHYSSEGDWALRVREGTWGGWDWFTAADGGERSLELRNPLLGNDNGQNWNVSSILGGTPGAANSVLSTDIPPVIGSVKHSPAVPRSSDYVLISCELADETPAAALTATLNWRDASINPPGEFQSVPMSSDGKGEWFAPLSPKPGLTIVEFFISASDGVNTRTWPAPTSEGQNANCQYQVDDSASSPSADSYRLVLTAAENQAFNSIPNSSDRQFNATLITTRGTETGIRYRCDMRIRGNSSRSYTVNQVPFRPLRIRMPEAEDLDGITRFNLQPRSSFLQHLGMKLFQAAGLRAPDTIPVELRRNGIKYATSTGATPDYGYWTRLEDIGSEMISRHWPLAGGGGAYKKGRNDYYWRATQPPPSTPDGILDGWIKQNNSAANDWSDVTGFFAVWQAAAVPHFPGSSAADAAGSDGASTGSNGNWDGTSFTAAEMTSLATVADFDQWARWFAVMTILQDYETNISNGQDDDYGAYFEPKVINGTLRRRLQFIPHDLDTIFGLGDTARAYNARGLYDATEDNSIFRPLLPLLGNSSVAGNATFRTMYFNALRELLGTVFDADNTVNPTPPFNTFVDYQLGGWAPDTVRTGIKDFMRLRREYLLGLIGAGPVTPASGTSNATVTAVHGALIIHEVLASNTSAHANGTSFPDVVELFNSGTVSIDLSGKSLTDDPQAKAKYVFPAGSTIAPGALLVLYADSDTATPGTHLGFGLDADGDRVLLYDSAANGQALIDSVTFGLQAADFSIGRTRAGLDTWALCTPTVGAANTVVSTLAAPSGLRINEWLGNADYRTTDDFVELHNPAAQPVALGGMSLTDDFINFPFRGTLPPLSFMRPQSFVAFLAKGSSAAPGNARELPFGIDATLGSVALLGSNGGIVDQADTVSQFRDVSTGRIPDGTGAWARLGVPSPGFSNEALPETTAGLLNWLRITEMMYNPATSLHSEYIEFRNVSDTATAPVTLDLSGVSFKSGITFTFPQGTTLAPGAWFILVGDPAKFQAQFPGVAVGGVFAGKLDNGGESLRFDIAGFDVAILDFKYSDNWYPSTDGSGDALQIVDAAASPARWDKQSGWQAAPPSPGSAPAFGVYAGPDLAIAAGQPLFLDGTVFNGNFAAGEVTIAWSKQSGPGTVTFTTPAWQDANARFSAPGTYVIQLAASAPGGANASDAVTVTVVEDYAAWSTRLLGAQSAADRLPGADPDGDGVVNLVEFAVGGDPADRSSTGGIQAAQVNGRLTLTWQRNSGAGPPLQIIPQISTDLQTWQEGPAVLEVSSATVSGRETWTAVETVPAGSRPRAAMRLKVTIPGL